MIRSSNWVIFIMVIQIINPGMTLDVRKIRSEHETARKSLNYERRELPSFQRYAPKFLELAREVNFLVNPKIGCANIA